MQVCSYYLNSHTDHLYTLNIAQGIAQGGTEHSWVCKDFSRKLLQDAIKLEEMTRTSTANISGLIRQIKSTVSAFSATNKVEESTNKVEEWTKKTKPIRIPAIVCNSAAIAALRRAADELGLPTKIQPTESCRRFLTLAHVNRRMRGDLLSPSSTHDISGDMKVFQKLLPKMSRECRELIVFVHLVIVTGGGPYSSNVQRQFASLSHLSNLKTAYISGVLEETPTEGEVENEDTVLVFRGRSMTHLLKTLEYRGIRTVLYLERYSEEFVQNSVVSGRWEELGRDTVKAREDRDRM